MPPINGTDRAFQLTVSVDDVVDPRAAGDAVASTGLEFVEFSKVCAALRYRTREHFVQLGLFLAPLS